MMKNMNRKAWRAIQAQRDLVAAILASGCQFADGTGKRWTVENPAARRALKRAFARLIAARGEPQVMRISDEAALAFPNQSRHEGAKAWLGVCLDIDGRGSFSLRWFTPTGLGGAVDERREAEARILIELEALSAFSGLPFSEVS